MRCPRHSAPIAWAASSITSRSYASRSALSRFMSTGRPARWTGMTALVFGDITASTSSRSRSPRLWHAVDEHGSSPRVLDCVRRGDEGHGREDDLVTGADAEDAHSKNQCGGAGRHAADVRAPSTARASARTAHLRARTDPAGAERVHDLLDFVVTDQGPAEDEEVVTHAETAGFAYKAFVRSRRTL